MWSDSGDKMVNTARLETTTTSSNNNVQRFTAYSDPPAHLPEMLAREAASPSWRRWQKLSREGATIPERIVNGEGKRGGHR